MQKILVIEDEEDLREVVVSALNNAGYQASSASNGLQGVEKAFADQPDLVISDVEMPNMDGLTVLTWLRNDPTTAAIPFILMTSFVEKVPMRLGMNAGADDYLSKPFQISDLVDAVKSRLAKSEKLIQVSQLKLQEVRTLLSSSLPMPLLAPLTEILSRTELLRSGGVSLAKGEVRECADTIDRSVARLHKLIQDHLLYTEIELAPTNPEKISEACERRTESPRKLIEDAAVSVAGRLNRSEDLVLKIGEIEAPIGQEYLKRITEELVENACQFSRPGTPVRVTTLCAGGDFELSVHDEGRGFRTGNPATSSAAEESDQDADERNRFGLGLAIVKRLAEMHGGNLTFPTTEGTAIEVEIRLPNAP